MPHQIVPYRPLADDYINIQPLAFISTGSLAETLFLPFKSIDISSDIDRMFEFPHIIVVDENQLTVDEQEKYQQSKTSLLYIDYTNEKYPCYVTLYFYSSLNSSHKETLEQLLTHPENKLNIIESKAHIIKNKQNFPSAGIVEWFQLNWNNTTQDKIEKHGPSVCVQAVNDPKLPLPMDHVPSLRSHHWPKSALTWSTRPRLSGWPNQQLIDKIIHFGCHLVALAHPLSDNYRNHEWRLSFSVGEVLLAHSLNVYQRKCYSIMKAIFKAQINSDYPNIICSYYLKTIFYWLCEKYKEETFNYKSLYDRFLDYINLVIECFRKKRIEHYFVSGHNLIEHLNENILTKIVNKCEEIKFNILETIQKCEYFYHNTNQYERFRPITDELNRSTNNDNSCIILYYASFIYALVMQKQIIDYSLIMVNECLERNYLHDCSDDSARCLINVLCHLADFISEKNECSPEFLQVNNFIMKACELKSFYDKVYQTATENFQEVKEKLEILNN
ncbi:unnamed protein product [Didymodactylos carnosus]|uniref:Mab-21-like HhH/H2TH-like domain-containing protein n=1 Tax=Didymodactylos carnosus TaxID=1234261 RepID=A0A815AHF2_9BILA|nr:unnamed protein product [Didymodactylos carnosus]CAF1257095.1 unnamed protein product [Didymodactylos carnosus]CAF3714468.1 unnamed protein product [Didymodactylos carnosus]CAF4031319.1 unnamed protein product [Didymodactylos carnosus]